MFPQFDFTPRIFFAAVLAALPAPSQAQSAGPEGFAAYVEAAADLGAALDREQFDLDALALSTALDPPEAIAARVDRLIATQVYAGALRGAGGTLRAGAGNSLDQALLLQRLLIDAGQEARIARVRLDEETARRLLASAAPADRPDPLADKAAAEAAIAAMERAAGVPDLLAPLRSNLSGGPPDVPLPQAATTETDRVAAALGPALPDGAGLDARLLEEARDYFWVQTRLFGTEDWTDLHVAFAPDRRLVPESFVAEPLPDALTYRVRVAFELEIREADRLRRMPLMEELRLVAHAEPPRPRVLTILPDGVIRDAETAPGAVPETTFHFPLLDGRIAPRGIAFTADGLTAQAGDVLESKGMASVIAAGAAKVSGAGGILGSLGAEPGDAERPANNTPLREVTGLWAVVTTERPDGGGSVFRRPLVDRIGADLRAEGQIFAPADAMPAETAMLGQWMVMLQTGGVGQAELAAGQIDRIREMTPAIAAGDERFGGLSVSNPAMQSLMTALFDTAAEAGAASRAGWTYRARPGLMLASQTYRADGEGMVQRSAIDILDTGRRALDAEGRALPGAALAAGVAETLAERMMADAIAVRIGQPPAATAGSWDLLTSARALEPVTGAGDIPALGPAARTAMEADLGRGQLLALAADGPAWWRVDRETGAAIGVDALGGGAESAEYITALDAVVTKTFAVYGTLSCTAAGGNPACCAAANIAWAGVGFSIWGLVGKGLETFTALGAVASGWVGLAGGAGLSSTGWNPYQGPC